MNMELRGNVHKFGDDVNTDLIISGKYKFNTLDMRELSKHVMEDIDPEFHKKISEGDFIVAGRNFGCGSSREQAPLAIKFAKISAVIAKSFARIFYRNSINIGLPVIICEGADQISDGAEIGVDLDCGKIIDYKNGVELKVTPMPGFVLEILSDGGLVEYLNKGKTFE